MCAGLRTGRSGGCGLLSAENPCYLSGCSAGRWSLGPTSGTCESGLGLTMLPDRDACSTTARSSAVLPMPGSPVRMIIAPALVRGPAHRAQDRSQLIGPGVAPRHVGRPDQSGDATTVRPACKTAATALPPVPPVVLRPGAVLPAVAGRRAARPSAAGARQDRQPRHRESPSAAPG